MPNYTITPRVISSMYNCMRQLIDRRTAVMSEDFPLTLDEVQTGLLAPEVRVPVEMIISNGAATMLTTTRYVKVDIPDNTANVLINFIKPLYYSTWTRGGEHKFFVDHLDYKKKLRLNKWCAKAIQEYQIVELTNEVVKRYLNRDRIITVAHILAQWPTLRLLVTDPVWVERFNSPPKSLKRYQWDVCDDHWRAKYWKAMKLADMILTSAIMLPEPSSKACEVNASVIGIVK